MAGENVVSFSADLSLDTLRKELAQLEADFKRSAAAVKQAGEAAQFSPDFGQARKGITDLQLRIEELRKDAAARGISLTLKPGIIREVENLVGQVKGQVEGMRAQVAASDPFKGLVDSEMRSAAQLAKSFQEIEAKFERAVAALKTASASSTFDPLSAAATRLKESVISSAAEMEKFPARVRGSLGTLPTSFGEVEKKALAAAAAGRQLVSSMPVETILDKAKAFYQLATSVNTFIAGILIQKVLGFAEALAKSGQEVEALRTKLTAFEGSADVANEDMQLLRDTAQGLGLDYESLTKTIPRLIASSKLLGNSTQETRDIITSLSTAMGAFSLSGEQTQRVISAIEQIMSKGKIQAEELRGQLGDSLPGALTILASKLGKTTAELDDMLRQGELGAKKYLPALAAAFSEAFGPASVAGAKTTAAEVARFNNAVVFASQDLGEKLNPEVRALVTALRDVVTGSDAASESLSSGFGGIIGILADLISGIDGLLSGNLEKVASRIGALFVDVARIVDGVLQGIVSGFLGVEEGIVKGVNDARAALGLLSDAERNAANASIDAGAKLREEGRAQRQRAFEEALADLRSKTDAELAVEREADAKRLKDRQDAQDRLNKIFEDGSSVQSESDAKAAEKEAKAFEALRQELDKGYASQVKYAEGAALINAALAAGKLSPEEAEVLLVKLKEATDKAALAAEGHAKALKSQGDGLDANKTKTDALREAEEALAQSTQALTDLQARKAELEQKGGTIGLSIPEGNELADLTFQIQDAQHKQAESAQQAGKANAGAVKPTDALANAGGKLSSAFGGAVSPLRAAGSAAANLASSAPGLSAFGDAASYTVTGLTDLVPVLDESSGRFADFNGQVDGTSEVMLTFSESTDNAADAYHGLGSAASAATAQVSEAAKASLTYSDAAVDAAHKVVTFTDAQGQLNLINQAGVTVLDEITVSSEEAGSAWNYMSDGAYNAAKAAEDAASATVAASDAQDDANVVNKEGAKGFDELGESAKGAGSAAAEGAKGFESAKEGMAGVNEELNACKGLLAEIRAEIQSLASELG